MKTVVFTETSATYDPYAFYQWDYGQQLQISGLTLEPTVEIHFAKPNTPAIVMLGETVNSITTVKVPDAILQYAGEMSVYIYVSTPTTAYTYRAITFQVRARQRPLDYSEQVEPGITAQFINKLNNIISTGIASYTPDVAEVNTMIQNYVSANMIANNLATTAAGLALDARQGKTLNDILAKTVIAVTGGTDVTVSNASIYKQGDEIHGYVTFAIASPVASDGLIASLELAVGVYLSEPIMIMLYGITSVFYTAYCGQGTNGIYATSQIPAGTYYVQVNVRTNN